MWAKNNAGTGLSSRVGGQIVLILVMFGLSMLARPVSPVLAAEKPEDDDAWFERALEQERLEQQALAVNEGELEILDKAPAESAHYHHNRMFIDEHSLRTGWVRMHQCHTDLDSVSAMQIVYNEDRIRNINVLSFNNMTSAWVEGNTVQLTDVGAHSQVCISADTRALSHSEQGYTLKNGPFMRRFLDGFYPMRVRLEVHYPAAQLELAGTQPVPPKLHDSNAGYVDIDIWIVGKLFTELLFKQK